MPETWNEASRESGVTPSWRRVPWGGGVRSGGVRTSAPSSAPEGAGCGYLCQCPTPKHALSSTNTRHLFHCFTEAGSFWCVWGWGVRSPSAVETRWRYSNDEDILAWQKDETDRPVRVHNQEPSPLVLNSQQFISQNLIGTTRSSICKLFHAIYVCIYV